MPELTARRKADRAAMALQVADLAAEYQLDIWLRPEQPGTRRVGVDLAGPHGLRLTVDFDGSRRALALDVYVLNWHGVEEGTRLHWGVFGHVNEAYGHKATDVAHGFDQLLRTLRDRFKVIADGSAFITSGGSGAVG